MNFVFYFIILCISIYFWYQRKYGERNNLLNQFPAPPKFFLLGHFPYFFLKKNYEMLETLTKLNASQPPVWRLDRDFFSSIITINDIKIVEIFLSSQKLLDKSIDYDFLKPWLGNGLLLSTGKKWHERRKIITPAFHFKILDNFVEIMENHGEIFIEKLRKFDGKDIDVFPMLSLYALDVICESAMGYHLNAQTDGNDSDYVNAVKEYTRNCFFFFYDIFLRIKYHPKRTKMLERQGNLLKKMHSFTNSVISERKTKFIKSEDENENFYDEFGNKRKLAFLDLLLRSKINGKSLNHEEIREEVDTFMFEGHDTTTSALGFTLLNLAKYPEIQRQVYEEISTINTKKSIAMKDLSQLNYLEMVIKESLRLYPSVPSISRSVAEPETIEGFTFPPNTVLKISPFLLGRDEKLFKDPFKFDPMRFSNDNEVKLFSFIPFSAGPRNCIGQKFAMLELKSLISKVIQNFEISVKEENRNPKLASELVLRPVNGIILSLKAR